MGAVIRRRRLPAFVAAALMTICVNATSARGQMVSATTGAIKGQLTDESDNPLPGGVVTIFSPAMQGLETATTNEKGAFRFPAIPPGTYKVAFQKEGYSTAIFDMVRISLGFTATVNARLKAQGKETAGQGDVHGLHARPSHFGALQGCQSPARVERLERGHRRLPAEMKDTAWWYFGFRRNNIETRLVNYPVEPQQTVRWNYS